MRRVQGPIHGGVSWESSGYSGRQGERQLAQLWARDRPLDDEDARAVPAGPERLVRRQEREALPPRDVRGCDRGDPPVERERESEALLEPDQLPGERRGDERRAGREVPQEPAPDRVHDRLRLQLRREVQVVDLLS